MKQFEITYTNGQIYSGETLSDWNACPATGVQNVTVLHDNGSAQQRIYGHDYYILDDDNQVIGTDIIVPGSLKEGELVSDAKFLVLKNSVFSGGPNQNKHQGHSRIWNRLESDAVKFTPGVRQGVVVED